MVNETSDQEGPKTNEAAQEDQARKDKMKEFIKRKLKPAHEEIIAPPGE